MSGNLAAAADVLQSLAGLHAMEGRFDRARELLANSHAAFEELGLTLSTACLTGTTGHGSSCSPGTPWPPSGACGGATRRLRRWETDPCSVRPRRYLAQALLAQRRDEEAERFAELSEELAAADDLLTQIMWRGVRARTLAGRGRLEEAERIAREAVALAERTDFINDRADALVDFAIVLRQAGHLDDARAALAEGLRLYEQKGEQGRRRQGPSGACRARASLRRSATWPTSSTMSCALMRRARRSQ